MSERGRLLVCATPIGNLGDVSDRLREALTAADLVYAEDTRRTAALLQHVGATPTVRSLFAAKETARTEELIARLDEGRTVVLVSDAGMPGISDPGAEAVRRARAISPGLMPASATCFGYGTTWDGKPTCKPSRARGKVTNEPWRWILLCLMRWAG